MVWPLLPRFLMCMIVNAIVLGCAIGYDRPVAVEDVVGLGLATICYVLLPVPILYLSGYWGSDR